MSSTAIDEVVNILETLPVDVQNQVLKHLREYIDGLQNENRWNEVFQKTQDKLITAAKRAKQEIAEGKAVELDYDQL